MQFDQSTFSGQQVLFIIDDQFSIIESNNDLEKWIPKTNESLDQDKSIHNLSDELKYPCLHLLSLLKLRGYDSVSEYFSFSTNTAIDGIYLQLMKSSDTPNHYRIVLTPVQLKHENKDPRLQAETTSSQHFDTVIKSIESLDEINKEELITSLKSLSNKLCFKEDQLINNNNDLNLLLENNNESCILIDHLFSIVKFNRNAYELVKSVFGKELQKNLVFTNIIPDDQRRKLREHAQLVLNGKEKEVIIDLNLRNQQEELRTLRFTINAVKRLHQELNAVTIVIEDITDQLLEERIKSINFQLMKVAMDPHKSNAEIATFFVNKFESIFNKTFCSILLYKDEGFINLSSPSLPEEYTETISQLKVTENTGSCGRAAHTQEIIISSDIWNDAKWIGVKEQVKKHNLRSCTSYPIINSSGKTIAVFGVYRKDEYQPSTEEIEIFKQFSELLAIISEMHNYKQKHENLLNSIRDGFFSLDKNFNVVYWNNTAEIITGINVQQSLGKNLWEVFPKIDKSKKDEFINLINTTDNGSMTTYFPLLKKWLELIIYPKGEEFISVFFRDVTSRIEKEQQLIDAKDRLETVMNTANDAIYELDLHSNHIIWSRGYQDLFGYDMEYGEQDAWERFELVHPDQQEKVINSFENTLEDSKKQKWSAEYSFKRSNGSYAHVMDRGYILRDSEGNAVKLIGAITDISYHKEYEESLVYLNKVLRERAMQLQQNNEELEQFAYLASHDLQEPLRTITNFIFQLERKYGDELDDKGKKYINFVVEGAERMRKLITDILSYSKIGKGENPVSLVDMNQLITSIQSNMKQQISENEASFKVTNLPKIDGNEAHLYQIFSNLISNAIKYRKKEVAPEIDISYQKKNGYHVFKVKDNGIGITPEFHGKIFEIFQRLHNDSEYSGTGIGLAMVKKSIDQLGGEVLVDNHESGTTFIVRIPEIQEIQEDKTKIMHRL